MPKSSGHVAIGPYSFNWEKDNNSDSVLWHVFVDDKPIGVYADSLDGALLAAMCYKNMGNVAAVPFIWDILKKEKKKSCPSSVSNPKVG